MYLYIILQVIYNCSLIICEWIEIQENTESEATIWAITYTRQISIITRSLRGPSLRIQRLSGNPKVHGS